VGVKKMANKQSMAAWSRRMEELQRKHNIVVNEPCDDQRGVAHGPKGVVEPTQSMKARRVYSITPSEELDWVRYDVEEVTFDCLFGWCSDEEWFDNRQTDPRLAP
jgi:hypothetical protein